MTPLSFWVTAQHCILFWHLLIDKMDFSNRGRNPSLTESRNKNIYVFWRHIEKNIETNTLEGHTLTDIRVTAEVKSKECLTLVESYFAELISPTKFFFRVCMCVIVVCVIVVCCCATAFSNSCTESYLRAFLFLTPFTRHNTDFHNL